MKCCAVLSLSVRRSRAHDLAAQSSEVLTFPPQRPGRSVEGVPSYFVETYLARGQAEERTARECRARSAVEELTQERTRVRFEHSIHVPEVKAVRASSPRDGRSVLVTEAVAASEH